MGVGGGGDEDDLAMITQRLDNNTEVYTDKRLTAGFTVQPM